MHACFLTAIAALAASATTAPLDARTAYATWPATEVIDSIAHILVGESFRLTAPAGYIEGAPAFDVHCTTSLGDKVRPAPCIYNGPQANGTKVMAELNINGTVTAYHHFGSQKIWGTSTVRSGPPLHEEFTIPVTYLSSALTNSTIVRIRSY